MTGAAHDIELWKKGEGLTDERSRAALLGEPPPLDPAMASALRGDNLAEMKSALYKAARASRDELPTLLPATVWSRRRSGWPTERSGRWQVPARRHVFPPASPTPPAGSGASSCRPIRAVA